jgi:hypothetical protein
MFVNLNFTSRPFKEYNWTDYGDLRPVHLSALQRQTREHTIASYGFDSEFLATLKFTLSKRCMEGFIRDNPGLPIDHQDYSLSKLFQFIFEAIVMRFDFTDPDGTLSRELVQFLNTLADPDDAAADFDWRKFYADLRLMRHGPFETVQRLSLYLPSAARLQSLSAQERRVLDELGEEDFHRFPNPELQKRHKIKLNQMFGSGHGEAIRSCLNRIRNKMGFPQSDAVRKTA